MDQALVVILDITSLISLSAVTGLPDVPKEERPYFWSRTGRLDTAIEALILYDSVLLDGPSWERNCERSPALTDFSRFCQPIAIDKERERKIYGSITSNFINRLEATIDNYEGLYGYDTLRIILGELGFPLNVRASGFASMGWEEVANVLSEGPATAVRSLKHRFERFSDDALTACLFLLRTLYYYQLQQECGVDLIVHPIRGAYFQNKPRIGANILGIFDQTVRREFEARKSEWLGLHNAHLELPLLTSYVLGKCDRWTDLLDVIEEIRSGDAAVNFRKGLRSLTAAIEDSDNKTIDDILMDLKSAKERWAQTLNAEGPRRKVQISVPYIGVSTDIEVPQFRLRKRDGEKMLVFIHTLLSEA